MQKPLVRPEASLGRDDPFPAIADYGVVGNLETVALIANTAAIEFFCYPEFDSPSIFAAMLDRGAGSFTLAVDIAPVGTQRYVEDTNVLVTRFEADGRIVDVTDFMPIGGEDATNQLVRLVTAVAGAATVQARCRPSFDYGRGATSVRRKSAGAVVFEDGGVSAPVRLVADRPVAIDGPAATVSAELKEGERLVLVMVADGSADDLLSRAMVDAALETTVRFWRGWLAQSNYSGEDRAAVTRSALALKLMFSDRHGSIVAAPTMALPEAIGGDRNWDYRYCWLRDSAFTIYAMLRLGFVEEADKYRCFLRDRVEEQGGRLNLMYRLDGSGSGLHEEVLGHLTGYRNSRPVRLGNAAHAQRQHDIYGEVIDTFWLAHRHIAPVSDRAFDNLSRVVDRICEHWDQPGNGFWEMRGDPQLFLDAHLMSWVGVDRALKLSAHAGRAPPADWIAARAEIRRVLEEEFFNPRIGAFTQIKGGERLDSVALLMPLMRFVPTTDGRFRSTLALLEERLVTGPFVRRYELPPQRIEGLEAGPPEGHFVACSFWYIEVLARSSRLEEARRRFTQLLGLASPLGLFAEEIATDGTHLGNIPQALSHLSLISCAVALKEAAANGGRPF